MSSSAVEKVACGAADQLAEALDLDEPAVGGALGAGDQPGLVADLQHRARCRELLGGAQLSPWSSPSDPMPPTRRHLRKILPLARLIVATYGEPMDTKGGDRDAYLIGGRRVVIADLVRAGMLRSGDKLVFHRRRLGRVVVRRNHRRPSARPRRRQTVPLTLRGGDGGRWNADRRVARVAGGLDRRVSRHTSTTSSGSGGSCPHGRRRRPAIRAARLPQRGPVKG